MFVIRVSILVFKMAPAGAAGPMSLAAQRTARGVRLWPLPAQRRLAETARRRDDRAGSQTENNDTLAGQAGLRDCRLRVQVGGGCGQEGAARSQRA